MLNAKSIGAWTILQAMHNPSFLPSFTTNGLFLRKIHKCQEEWNARRMEFRVEG